LVHRRTAGYDAQIGSVGAWSVGACGDGPVDFFRIDLSVNLCYRACVHETITIRPTVPKAELMKRSGGNLNKWINGLIERAIGEKTLDWDAHFRRPRRKVRFRADGLRKASR